MLVSCYTEDPRKCITFDVVVHLPTKQVVVSSNRTGFFVSIYLSPFFDYIPLFQYTRREIGSDMHGLINLR